MAYNVSNTGSPTGNGFTQNDVTSIETDIRVQLGRTAKVDDVELMIESPAKNHRVRQYENSAYRANPKDVQR